MADRLLIDTDVVIDFLRDQPEAVTFFEELPGPPLLSAITVAELYAGVREGDERAALDLLIASAEIIPLSPEIAVKAGLFRRDYRKSHSVELPDALIAATAQTRNATLVTLNKKHFPMLQKVTIPYKKTKRGSST